MVNPETEKIILAAWFQGYNLQDMDLFEPKDFPVYGSVVDVMKSGTTDPTQILKAVGMTASHMSDIISAYMPTIYEQAIASARNYQAKIWRMNNQNATPEQTIEAMQRYVRRDTSIPSPSKDPLQDYIEELDQRGKEPMVRTGLSQLDNLLCGIRRKELTAVGARPSVGKSAFIQQISMEVAKQGKKVLFFPLEMSQNALVQRMFLRYVNIPQYEIRNGKTELWKRPGVNEALEKLNQFFSSGNWLCFERCNDLNTIRELIRIHKPHMVAIDQLEQLKDKDANFRDKRERFSYMTHELQAISLDENVAVWFACQINRGADNTAPTMANLKESGTIEEDSSNVILLHREGDRGIDQRIQLELAKQRDGECGKIGLIFKAPKFTFYGTDGGY